MKIRAVVAFVCGILLFALAVPSTAWGAKLTKPVITSFTATAVEPYEALTTSPVSLYETGGEISLQTTVSGATDCNFTANRPLPGLPYSVPCTSSATTTVTLPANTGKKAVVYKFKLRVIGERAAHVGPITVTVSTTPNPNPDPFVPGSTWDLTGEGCRLSGDVFVVGIGSGDSMGISNAGAVYPGTYSFSPGQLTLTTEALGTIVLFADQPGPDYSGGGICSWTLTPADTGS